MDIEEIHLNDLVKLIYGPGIELNKAYRVSGSRAVAYRADTSTTVSWYLSTDEYPGKENIA